MSTTLSPAQQAERDRVVEMSLQLSPRLIPAYAVIGALLASSIPTFGWWIMSLLVIDAGKAVINQRVARTAQRPEWFFAFDQYTSMTVIAYGVFLTGGAASPFLPLLALHAALTSAVFGRFLFRTTMCVLAIHIVLAGLGDQAVAEGTGWLRVGAMLALVTAIVVCVRALFDSDTVHREASRLDGLTGLPNRRSFNDAMSELSTTESSPTTSLVVTDIDFFKRVNDEHGHAHGDEVLIAVARELDAAFRATDVAYRVGGEEFAVVLHGVDAGRASAMARSLCQRIADARPAGTQLTMSFGVATTSSANGPDDLYRLADQALFEAKRAGRNRVMVAHTTSA